MQRARAAERDERKLTRIEAPLDRHNAEGTKHLRINDFDGCRRIDPIERTFGRIAIQL